MADKVRLDILLVRRGVVSSREKAKQLITSGCIYAGKERMKKAGEMVLPDISVEIRDNPFRYVSRGGLKLEKMVNKHMLRFDQMTCVDIGASSGGFTDCMLQHGAERVYAVDVGFGQLAEQLQKDGRVVNLEHTNIRAVTKEQISEPIDFGTVDVSFISLTLVLPVLYRLLKEGGEAVCLVKPQFEAGKAKVGKKGVVREASTHFEVLEKTTTFCFSLGFAILDMDYSPIKGPEGNIEYLLYLKKQMTTDKIPEDKIKALVKESHDGSYLV